MIILSSIDTYSMLVYYLFLDRCETDSYLKMFNQSFVFFMLGITVLKLCIPLTSFILLAIKNGPPCMHLNTKQAQAVCPGKSTLLFTVKATNSTTVVCRQNYTGKPEELLDRKREADKEIGI